MVKLAVLVYQAGIANVFAVENVQREMRVYVPSTQPHANTPIEQMRNARRLYQGDFHSAAMFARGLRAAGADVRTACCNMAGDIINQPWNSDYDEQPFSDKYELVGGVL